jgi:hypothetical protein
LAIITGRPSALISAHPTLEQQRVARLERLEAQLQSAR